MTTTTTPKIGFTRTKICGNEKTVVKVTLDDDCKNGHCDFSVTAYIYEETHTGGWRDIGGGCCHEHILKLWPDLAPLVALHLADQDGTPMHAIANAFYWLAGCAPDGLGTQYHGGSGRDGKTPEDCRRIFMDHCRTTEDETAELLTRGIRSQAALQYHLEEMGVCARWQRDAAEGIAMIEKESGPTWPTDYAPTRPAFKLITPEEREKIRELIASGYYPPEKVAERAAEEMAAKVEKERTDIVKDCAKGVAKLEKKRDIALEMLRVGAPKNWIFYDHTGEVSVNWTSTEKLMNREQFDAVENEVKLPEGVKMVWNEKPKY